MCPPSLSVGYSVSGSPIHQLKCVARLHQQTFVARRNQNHYPILENFHGQK